LAENESTSPLRLKNPLPYTPPNYGGNKVATKLFFAFKHLYLLKLKKSFTSWSKLNKFDKLTKLNETKKLAMQYKLKECISRINS
jgi:hypothetical protein